MIGWETRPGARAAVRCEINLAFTRALHALSKERGGGYIPLADVEARAAKPGVVIPPLPVIVIPALPVIIPRLP